MDPGPFLDAQRADTPAGCPGCGGTATPGDRYCWRCGTALAPAAERAAGLWLRAAAWLIDAVACLIPLYVVLGLLAASRAHTTSILHPERLSSSVVAGVTIGWAVLVVVYFTVLASQTLGQMALGIRVVDARTGAPVGWGRGLIRIVLRFVFWLSFIIPGLVADLFTVWTRRRRNLIDLIARTVVVRT